MNSTKGKRRVVKEDVFRVSTPHGLVEVGWRLVSRNSSSNIICLPCMEEGELATAETLEGFVNHLAKGHSSIAHFLKLRNFHKMIV